MKLDGKVAVVTGGAMGNGLGIVKVFLKYGADVIIIDYSDKLQATLQELKSPKVLGYSGDIRDKNMMVAITNDIIAKKGKIDILVNNAGICQDSLLLEKSVASFRRILDVNLIGTYLCSKYVAKVMLDRGGGKIINISSTNAIDTYYPESCDYDASKAGVISLTHNMAREFAPHILVNCVCPGWVKTDMNAGLSIEQIQKEEEKILLHRFAEADEIAKVVLFLASSKASYINDSIIRVDGGKFNG